jgi:hypothetical protein
LVEDPEAAVLPPVDEADAVVALLSVVGAAGLLSPEDSEDFSAFFARPLPA